MGSLLIGAAVSLAVAAGNLVILLAELHDKLQFYQLVPWNELYLAETLAYSATPLAVAVVVLAIVNGAWPRHRTVTGLVVLCAFVVGFIALLSAWGITFDFLWHYS